LETFVGRRLGDLDEALDEERRVDDTALLLLVGRGVAVSCLFEYHALRVSGLEHESVSGHLNLPGALWWYFLHRFGYTLHT